MLARKGDMVVVLDIENLMDLFFFATLRVPLGTRALERSRCSARRNPTPEYPHQPRPLAPMCSSSKQRISSGRGVAIDERREEEEQERIRVANEWWRWHRNEL